MEDGDGTATAGGARAWVAGWVVPAAALGAAMVVFFLLIGNTRPAAGPNPVVSSPQAASLAPGTAAPSFSTTAFDGSSFDLAALRGKVVLVNFFASWCAECRGEAPAIEAAYVRYRDSGLVVVGVNSWEHADGRAFYKELGLTYPAVADPSPAAGLPGPIASAYGLRTEALPVSVFIDRDGKVHRALPGAIDADVVATQLKEMGIN